MQPWPCTSCGVLFKETRVAEWHAFLNGREVPIYEAGPGMMYVPVGPEIPAGSTLAFSYRISVAQQLAALASLVTAALFVLWVLGMTLMTRLSWTVGFPGTGSGRGVGAGPRGWRRQWRRGWDSNPR